MKEHLGSQQVMYRKFSSDKKTGTFVESIFEESKKYPHKVQEALQFGTNLNLLQDKYIFT